MLLRLLVRQVLQDGVDNVVCGCLWVYRDGDDVGFGGWLRGLECVQLGVEHV